MNYLYNGVELPALPEWDMKTYPYAAITLLYGNYYYFYVFAKQPYVGNTKRLTTNDEIGEIPMMRSNYLQSTAEWSDFPGEETLAVGGTVASSVVWANFDVLNEDGSVYLAASTPVPVGGSTPLDPTSLLMGWMVGKRVAGLRSQRSVTYNLADFSGSYIARETWTGTSDSGDGCEYEHVNFGVGEFPLTMVTYSNFAGSTHATEGNATNFSLQGFKPKKGQRVEIKYYFPEIELSYASQCTNLVIERHFEISGNNANLFIDIMDNSVEVSDGYYQGLFRDDYTLTPIIQDGTCVGFTFTGTLATDVESESEIYFSVWYGYDALPDGPVGYVRMEHHNYDSLSINVTPHSQK